MSGVVDGGLSNFVTDVVKSFDTNDRGVSDILNGSGLPAGFSRLF